MPSTPISNVTERDIQDIVLTALRADIDPTVIEGFLSSIDWSGFDAPFEDELIDLTQWTDEISEGVLTRWAYASRLISLLPESERFSAFGAPRPIVFTIRDAQTVRPAAQGRATQSLPAQSGTPDQMASPARGSSKHLFELATAV